MHPVNDKLKVEILSDGPFSSEERGVEKGIVVELPAFTYSIGYHSFAFESSYGNAETNGDVLKQFQKLKDKLVFWESLQDRGRRFKEGDKEYAFINMTDIIAYSDNKDINVQTVDQVGSAGSFNL